MLSRKSMLICVGLALCAGPALAAGSASGVSSGTSGWAQVAQWPEFMGGVWGEGNLGGGAPGVGAAPKLKPGYKAPDSVKQKAALFKAGSASCEPNGLPSDVGGEFFFSKGTILLLNDMDYSITRQIHMDRTTHGDPDPSYYGDSIGHWEGDTLVVDTTGFLPEVPAMSLFTNGSLQALPGDGKTHVVERYRLVSPDKLQLTLTVTNPEILAEPWVTVHMFTRHRDWKVSEAYCTQNNRDAPVDGEYHQDLTPPSK